ncbi:phospholipase D-like domain-containing protein [Sphingosinicella terrae]|uniref:phospholipase D-like domain-containing protein n=1 Tax=Sphingosinicella terrae TaxID=2172047 RepID=UPI002547804B|nr:phospholipase D-like domain-containing protein [Sphingosinicella terrae]
MSDASHEGETGLPVLSPPRNCWRIERTDRAALIVDAADYFRLARAAMLRARSQILLIGWDFDTRLQLVDKDEGVGAPIHLGPLLSWLASKRPYLSIHILAWDGKMYSFLGRGTTLLRLAEWKLLKRNIHFKLDGKHPLEGCHHHKILVIDDRFACAGGIDMTGSRWDTRAHRDDEPGRKRPTTGRHYGPWHDATMAVDGDAAKALGELGRRRWQLAAGQRLSAPDAQTHPWPDDLEAQFRDVHIGIARTCGETDEVEEVREIEALFIDMIHAARRFVYIESQYFASRAVTEAIAARLAEPEPPEFVVINPCSADGWLEEAVMGAARADLLKAVREADHEGRFRIYTPVTEGRRDIYVHAKIMVVDDRLIRVGSANLNNRSMGLDSECDLVIGDAPAEAIAAVRRDLIAEHLGVTADELMRAEAQTGSIIAAIERLRGEGRSLVPFDPSDYSEASKALARSEVADPESASEPIEPLAQRKLLRGLRNAARRGARRRRRHA